MRVIGKPCQICRSKACEPAEMKVGHITRGCGTGLMTVRCCGSCFSSECGWERNGDCDRFRAGDSTADREILAFARRVDRKPSRQRCSAGRARWLRRTGFTGRRKRLPGSERNRYRLSERISRVFRGPKTENRDRQNLIGSVSGSCPGTYTPIGCQVVLISVNASMKSRPCASSAR